MALNDLDLLRYSRNAIQKNLIPEEEEAVDMASDQADHGVRIGSAVSDAERIERFRNRIEITDSKLRRMQTRLEHMGVPSGIAEHYLLRDTRTLEQVRALRCANGAAETPLLTPDYFKLYEKYSCSGLPENYAPAKPRVKEATELMPHEQTVRGVTYVLYGDPEAEKPRLIAEQGLSRYPMQGTCGLCSSGNVLSMAGAEHVGEEDMIGLAMHGSDSVLRSLHLFEENTTLRGGTSSQGRQELLRTAGLESYLLPVKADRDQTMREVAQLVKEGRGVILSVDVERFWKQGTGGHAITLLAVSEDGQTFFYSDTGMGCIKPMSASELGKCLSGRKINVTEGIIR